MRPITISRSWAEKEQLEFVNQAVDWASSDPFPKDSDTLVIKFSWALGKGPNRNIIEPRLLSECGGMFGLPKHLYSFRAHHKNGCPTTNHLFLPSEDQLDRYRWKLFDNATDDPPEYRTLLVHVITFVGDSLVSAKTVRSLVRAVIHAHLGKSILSL